MKDGKKHVIIIGGGAAGCFCAANLDAHKYQITILEQNKDLLQKVKISGGGRCNVTHACFDPRELSLFYPRGSKELRSVFSKFQPGDMMQWLEERGVAVKIENDNRIFPESNSSQTIIDCFLREMQKNGVQVHTQSVVHQIIPTDVGYTVHTKDEVFHADIILFSTGSSPKSLQLLENLGHHIISPVPSLFTFTIQDALLNELSGTSFPNATVKIKTLKSEETGALLITHWGLSGPVILRLSAWQARELAKVNYQFTIEVNFISEHIEKCIETMEDYKSMHPNKTLSQSKIFDITNRFWSKILTESQIEPYKTWMQVSKKGIRKIAETLCQKEFQVQGKSTFKDEFVTAGGVELKEIDFKTMASKLLPNFYIAGEVLDIDAITGGFNFQACWSEAWIIATHLNEMNG